MAVFKIAEFIEMAVKDEDSGAAFYKALAETTNNGSIKSAYLKMADQEIHHADRFKKMLKDVPVSSKREEYSGQYEKYLSYLLESRAFSSPEKAAAAAKNYRSDVDALMQALRIEKDTLLFYKEIRELLPNTHQKIIDDIITEEHDHVSSIMELMEKLN